jgi:hypothetical protein
MYVLALDSSAVIRFAFAAENLLFFSSKSTDSFPRTLLLVNHKKHEYQKTRNKRNYSRRSSPRDA